MISIRVRRWCVRWRNEWLLILVSRLSFRWWSWCWYFFGGVAGVDVKQFPAHSCFLLMKLKDYHVSSRSHFLCLYFFRIHELESKRFVTTLSSYMVVMAIWKIIQLNDSSAMPELYVFPRSLFLSSQVRWKCKRTPLYFLISELCEWDAIVYLYIASNLGGNQWGYAHNYFSSYASRLVASSSESHIFLPTHMVVAHGALLVAFGCDMDKYLRK